MALRKNYIDNVRWIFVLLLFPYHTFRVYDTFDESFYIKGENIQAVSNFIIAAGPWLMPFLFLLSGISSIYALKKRTAKEYIKERMSKLLIPFLFGVLLLVPIQTYFAEVFHNGYTGNYFEQYVLFFTKPTDLSGYRGGFTPAHLWFILYLFIISIAALPVMYFYKKSVKKLPVDTIPLPVLLLFFIIPGFTQVLLDISGKSIGEYLAWFLIGYFFISSDAIQEKLQKYRFLLLGFTVPCMIVYTLYWETILSYNQILFEFIYFIYAWFAILTIIGLGKQYLNFTNSTTAYLSRSSFSIYVFHQQWIVITAYFSILWIYNIPLQMIIIVFTSVIFTFLTYEIFRRFSMTRFMFAIKK
jgi:hypothetical protein